MNKVITFPTRINFKMGYRKLVGRTSYKYLMKALQSNRASVRYAAVETILVQSEQYTTLSYFRALSDHHKDCFISGIRFNQEGK